MQKLRIQQNDQEINQLVETGQVWKCHTKLNIK